MGSYHCTCDPHGDNAKCARECCKPRRELSHDDKLALALRDYWEDDAAPDDPAAFRAILARHGLAVGPIEHTGLEYRGG